MGNELKYQFTSLETSLKHLGKSKWQICTQYGFKRGRQPAVLKILQSVYHRSEVVSCIISYQFQYRPPHFVQENINHRHCIRISSCREACAAIFPNTALNNCYALACIWLYLAWTSWQRLSCLLWQPCIPINLTSLLQTVLSIPFANDLYWCPPPMLLAWSHSKNSVQFVNAKWELSVTE